MIMLGVVHAKRTSMCLDPHLNSLIVKTSYNSQYLQVLILSTHHMRLE